MVTRLKGVAYRSDEYYTQREDGMSLVVVTDKHPTDTLFTDRQEFVVDPNWKMKVAKLQNATLPYERIANRILKVPSVRSNSRVRSAGKMYNSFNLLTKIAPPIFPTFDTSVQDWALKRWKSKLNDSVGKFDSLAPSVELRELKKGCESLVKSTQTPLRLVDMKLNGRGKKFSPKALAAYAGDAWLQWSFGIKPLLSDIQHLNDALDAYFKRKDHVAHISAGARVNRTATHSYPWQGPLGFNIRADSVGGHVFTTRYKAAIKLDLLSSADFSTSSVFGLEYDDLFPALWELTPYSWLIDYFTTIGDYINDEIVVKPTAIVYCSRTDRIYSWFNTSFTPIRTFPANDAQLTNWNVRGGLYDRTHVKRVSLVEIPPRSIRLKMFEEIASVKDPSGGINKLLNLLSIQAGNIARR